MGIYKKSLFVVLPLSLIAAFTLGGCTTRMESDPLQYINSSAITVKVKEDLLQDPKMKSYHITVSTYKDTVTLGGYVPNQKQEERAIDITRRVRGVKYVVDNMAIKDS